MTPVTMSPWYRRQKGAPLGRTVTLEPSGKGTQEPVLLQGEDDFAHREPDDVGVRPLDTAHRERADSLDCISAGLVHPFAGRCVPPRFFGVETAKLNEGAHRF